MRFVLGCVFLACFIIVLDCKDFRCDYTYFPLVDAFLKYHEVPAIFQEASLRCEFEGAQLATPLNEEMRYTMSNLVQAAHILTGLHTKFSSGDFFSMEGIPLSMISHSWGVGEPDNSNNDKGCIAMLKDRSLAEVRCSDPLPYICYKNAAAVRANVTNCGTTDQNYVLNSKTGSCYKFHRFPRVWPRAFMTCAAEGGYLAIINSDAEAAVIQDIYAKNTLMVNVGTYWTAAAFVGIYDWDKRGEWRTIHGQTLQEAGYSTFHAGQPDNFSAPTHPEFCGAVFKDAKYDDLWCDSRAQFICEKDPKSLVTCLN